MITYDEHCDMCARIYTPHQAEHSWQLVCDAGTVEASWDYDALCWELVAIGFDANLHDCCPSCGEPLANHGVDVRGPGVEVVCLCGHREDMSRLV